MLAILFLNHHFLRAQSSEIPIIRNPDAYEEIDAPVDISFLQNGSTVEKTMTINSAEKLFFDVNLPSESTYYYDEKLTLVRLYNSDGTDTNNNPVLINGGAHLGDAWFPRRAGSMVFEYQTKWHDRGKSPKGVPIIINKEGPPYVETIRITVTVSES